MIVDEREQVSFPAADHRPVQRVAGPQLVRAGRLEPAEHRRRAAIRAGGELQPHEMALQGPLRGRPPAAGAQDPGDLRGGAGRVLPFQRRSQLEHLRRGAQGDLAGRRHQRVEPASPPGPDPPVQAGPRHPHRLAERPGMLAGGQLADQPASLPGRQPRIGRLPDQRVPEQRDSTGPLRAAGLLIICSGHRQPPEQGIRGLILLRTPCRPASAACLDRTGVDQSRCPRRRQQQPAQSPNWPAHPATG